MGRQRQLYLVAYDICDPKRLARVHRFLSDVGLPMQYSVFTVSLSARKLQSLAAGLSSRIDCREDDLRIYPIFSLKEGVTLGTSPLPDGIILIESGVCLGG